MYQIIETDSIFVEFWPEFKYEATWSVAFNKSIHPLGWYTAIPNLEMWEVGQLLGGN